MRSMSKQSGKDESWLFDVFMEPGVESFFDSIGTIGNLSSNFRSLRFHIHAF